MKTFCITIFTFLLGLLSAVAQEKGFTIRGQVCLPDGYNVSLACHNDTTFSLMLAETEVRDGIFTLSGHVDYPCEATLMTNNLALVEKNQWPQDSISWTYTNLFISNDDITATLSDPHAEQLVIDGGQPQRDYNEWMKTRQDDEESDWTFIESHPASVVSLWRANDKITRAYHLTAEQVARLEKAIKPTPDDRHHYAMFLKNIVMARKTVKDAPLVTLSLTDVQGNPADLVSVVRNIQGAAARPTYVLIDFWASWCGICLHAMSDVKRLADTYADRLKVIGVSIDTKPEAWKRSMEKHHEPWPQYRTTEQGYRDLFDKYQVGNGVPYYLLLSPEGKVIASPGRPEDIEPYLQDSTH